MTTKKMEIFCMYIERMCHAIGFDPNEIKKNQRTHKYFRNYYCAEGENKKIWEELVKLGYAFKAPSSVKDGYYYYVSRSGLDILENIYKIKLEARD